MKIIICIPARYKSTRLPGKPLLCINGKTIINHVYDKVQMLKKYNYNIIDIVVLTDQDNIKNEIEKFGGKCCIINEECVNGTDRIIYYLKNNYDNSTINNAIIVNVQGDEPFIDPLNIKKAIDNYIDNFHDNKMVCSTIHHKTRDKEIIKLKSRGKLVLDNKNNIMYCSRNVIPSDKNNNIVPNIDYYLHIGIFVFRAEYLINHYFNNNTRLQLIEDIEWMKIMEQGFKINSIEVEDSERGVDTLDDYNYLVNKYK
jgi:3-deoxy-manno-octulosonate cytidylyltransferase (CMP-KDO synthetase)